MRIMLPRMMFLGHGSSRDGAPGTNLAKKGNEKLSAAVIP